MTDGILLAELQHDRDLLRYDTLIIDEAHERSLNVDFLLGYLKRLLPRRPDLKVVITSATIDPERFAAHFADASGRPAPIIEVSGRTYPVEVRYRPLLEEVYDDEEGEPVQRDQTEAVEDAVDELLADTAGDILVFLPGEREIRDTADALKRRAEGPQGFDVVPLYSRLSAAEQHRVFERHTRRRVVLATNVAETSLTVPGISAVIDTGLARISRWSARTKVQRLPIEPISQASAKQRSGRCGRVEAGIAIRLYSQEDFEGRPEFTQPEILRTSLASVILQMTSLGLGQVERFPFVDPPDTRAVRAGVQLLEELGALAASDGRRGDRRRLTGVGRKLARLPIDPRLARMILEADRVGCLREVLVITAALSIQDPRERPVDQQARADQLHARFRDPRSDFLAWLNLWRHLREKQREMGSSAFRRMCREEHLNYLRVREWQDFESQLRQVAKQVGLKPGPPADVPDADGIHRALLAGLLSHIGLRDPDRRDYLGARGARFAIFPGSGLFKSQPDFVMAAELVETSRLWGRQNAAIDPLWAERLAGDLAKRTWSEPHWSSKREAALAHERVTLYGVPLVADRVVPIGRHQPDLARELFIRHALVQGEWRARHRFFETNRRLLDEAAELEHRARRHDIVVDEQTLVRLLRRPDPGRGGLRGPLRHVVEAGAARPPRPAHVRPRDAGARRGRTGRGRLPRRLAGRVADPAAALPLRARPRRGRRHHRRPAGHAEHRRCRPLHLERPGAAPGARDRPDPVAAQAAAGQLRAGSRCRAPVPRRGAAGGGAAAGRAVALPALAHGRARAAGGVGRREGARPPASDVPGPRRRRAPPSGPARTSSRSRSRCGPPSTARCSRRPTSPGMSATGQTTWTFGTIEPSFTQTRAGHEVHGYPALVDEGSTVGLRVARLARRAGGPSPARRTPAAAARRALSGRAAWSTGSTTPRSSGWRPRRTPTSAR